MIDACDHCHHENTPGGGLLCAEGCICRDCSADLYAHDECPRCHQTRYRHHGALQCAVCDWIDANPEHEAMRLFQPAPNQIPGQLGLGS